MTDLLQWGSLSFREKRLSWSQARGVVALAVRHRPVTALGAAAVLGLAGSGYFAIGYVRYERLMASDQAAISHTASANADLQDALARMRDQVAAANQTLSTAQSRVAALSDEARRQLASSEQAVVSKGDRISQLTHALEQAQRELHLAEAQRVTLLARLSKAEAELTEGLARQQQAQAGLEQWQKKIQQLTNERDRAASERDQLRARVGQLEKQSLLQPHQPAPATAAAAPPTAAVAAAPAVPRAAIAATNAAPAAAAAPARVALVRPLRAAPAVAASGAARAIRARAGLGRGRCRASVRANMACEPASAARSSRCRAAVLRTTEPGKTCRAASGWSRRCRSSAPLTSYHVEQPVRQCAATRTMAVTSFHTGIDHVAPYESPVYATAPGVVTFSGYRDDYGKIVEIDHGHGIVDPLRPSPSCAGVGRTARLGAHGDRAPRL